MENSNNTNRSFWNGVLIGVFSVLIILIPVLFGDSLLGVSNGRVAVGSILLKLDKLNTIMSRNYLDYLDYDDNSSVEAIEDSLYSGYVARLNDPYSRYLSKTDIQRINDSVTGSFVGIGVTIGLSRVNNRLFVTNVNKGGPADRAGIKDGDIIYMVDNKLIVNMMPSDLTVLLRGEKGTSVHVTTMRDSERHEYDLVREDIVTKTVSSNISDNIGIIEIYSFDSNTGEQFEKELNSLEEKNVKGIIIDLRDNQGGIIDAATDVCSHFLPNKIITFTVDKHGNKIEFKAKDNKECNLPVAIVVNGNTASASEIMTGAFKDYNRAVIVGSRTYGKGIVQTFYDLGDGTGLELTVAKYYTPNGANIQYIGIEPDIEKELDIKQYSINKTDSQIEAAKEAINE